MKTKNIKINKLNLKKQKNTVTSKEKVKNFQNWKIYWNK